MDKRIQIERMRAVVDFFDDNPARVARTFYNAGYRRMSDVIEVMIAAGIEQNKIKSVIDEIGIDLPPPINENT